MGGLAAIPLSSRPPMRAWPLPQVQLRVALCVMTRKLLVAIKRVIDYNAKVRVKAGAIDLSNVKVRLLPAGTLALSVLADDDTLAKASQPLVCWRTVEY